VVPEGNAKICCVAGEAVRDKTRPMNVAENSLEEIRRSPYMRKVREALADGRKIPVCGYCWEQEKRGEGSLRQQWNNQFAASTKILQESLREGADPAEPLPLEYLQISVGNKCNLACRMCTASYSSRIEEDPVHFKWAGKTDRDVTVWVGQGSGRPAVQSVPKRSNWIEGTAWFEQPEFVEKDMMGAGSTVKLLYVTGGEPLFVPAFDKILDDYVARGLAQDMTISLNSNLFHNERRVARAMESLLKFKQCHIAPSIDGHGAGYEYIRYPAKWAVVERNIRHIADLRRDHRNLSFVLTTVAQAYNCFNLVDLFRFADELYVDCIPHVIDGPYQLRLEVLPAHLRSKAAEQLRAYAGSPGQPGSQTSNRGHAARVARYLEACQETDDLPGLRGAFVAFTRDLDASRGQSLERSVPELREMLTLFG
jgi:MoaA/NifB/PqqE/SkfB family radical SAM enzyme